MQIAMAHAYDYTLPLGDNLKAVSDAGFRIVTLGAQRDHSNYHTKDGRKILKKLCAKLNLRIQNIHTPLADEQRISSADEEQRTAGVREVLDAIEACGELDCGMIVVHLSHRAGPAEYNSRLVSARKSMTEILPPAEKAGVKIACENLFTVASNEILREILDEFDHPMLGLCYDSSHANLSGNPLEFLAAYGRRLFITHISDNRGEHDDHILPGMGEIDWKTIMGVIGDTGFEGPLLPEVEREPSGYTSRPPLDFTSEVFQKGQWLLKML